jgi:ribosomal protein S18 acetylase RimI-like enzyme
VPTPKIILSIFRSNPKDVGEVHAFHLNQTTEFIWPRTPKQLEDLADNHSLFVVRMKDSGLYKGHIVGMCYITEDKEIEGKRRWELGGICVSSEFRGYGIGSSLCLLAISCHYHDQEPHKRGERLIAHVHEDNPDPRNMLKQQLGFIQVDKQYYPANPKIPPNMRKNEKGELVGDIFEFKTHNLKEFADWIEMFQGQVIGKKGSLSLEVNLSLFSSEYIFDTIKELKEISSYI